jgi:enoyl-[acyl-carrier-protein] reductase (NADH)
MSAHATFESYRALFRWLHAEAVTRGCGTRRFSTVLFVADGADILWTLQDHSMSYLVADRVVPGYGVGMSSAKAALDSDTRTLAWEAGRKWGHRVNCISAGPLASRAASAIGKIHRIGARRRFRVLPGRLEI